MRQTNSMLTPLLIDGATGEGGGQILRTSLALSVITGRAFRIFNIRGNRPKPGLRRQHLTCVLAAAEICGAEVNGAAVDSRDVTFTPPANGGAQAGTYHFDIGSAGSTMLVLQTVLPALMLARGPSTLLLEGGTHNFGAPPLPFLAETFLPQLRRMGVGVDLALERAGFAPAGGGRVLVSIQPATTLGHIELLERGALRRKLLRATVAGLPTDIALREIKAVGQLIELKNREWKVEELPPDQGPGNVVTLHLESEHVTEVVTAFGRKGLSAERVGQSVAEEAARYLASGVPVGEHLADQLLLPMALAGGGAYVTGPLSLHATTNIQTIQSFLNVAINVRELPHNRVEVRVGK